MGKRDCGPRDQIVDIALGLIISHQKINGWNRNEPVITLFYFFKKTTSVIWDYHINFENDSKLLES